MPRAKEFLDTLLALLGSDGKQQAEFIAPASLGEQPSGLKTPAPLIGRRLSTLDEKQSGEGWREALSAEQRAALPHGMQLHPPSAAIDLTIGKNAADETAPLVYDVLLEFFFAEGTPKKLAMRVPNPRKADEVKIRGYTLEERVKDQDDL